MNARACIRIVLDVNVLVSDIVSRAGGRTGTISQKLVDAVQMHSLGGFDLQLVLSVDMLNSLEAVLLRLGMPVHLAESATQALLMQMRHGPDALDPYLLLDQSELAFALRDREDAKVLATAFAARAQLLITDNLKDFETADCKKILTTRVRNAGGTERQLYCLVHTSPDGRRVIVAHPVDIVLRAAQGKSILFDDIA